jgi:hypothetical protein
MIWLNTVWFDLGCTWNLSVSSASPSSIVPKITPSSNSVRFARATRGSRNSGTPLAMASTPVRALHPAENAFNTSRTVTACTVWLGTSDVPV